MRAACAARAALAIAAAGTMVLAGQVGKSPVKVFVFAGQSNMQGKGSIKHLEQLTREKPAEYGHLRKGDKWVVRDDVWVKFWDKKGGLTVGYGKPESRFGPELGFGHVVGDALEEQVLIIKVAWGGQNLAVDLRPPSSGKPAFELPQKLRDRIAAGQYQVGIRYKQMLEEVRNTLAHLKDHFPDYGGKGCEIAGFVWFQGFNDAINTTYRKEYQQNLANLVRDIRRDFGKPKLPVVIGEFGQSGPKPYNYKHTEMRKAQRAVVEQFRGIRGKVALALTTTCFHAEPHFDGGYHYRGNAETFYEIGKLFGQHMLKMLD